MSTSPSPTDSEQFAAAVAVANLPTLLMVLVQMTGETRWLQPPYRPSRAVGLGDNDNGGLPPEIQAEVRAAALAALIAWRAGRPVAIAAPTPEMLVEMLSVSMGEEVPAEYGRFTEELFGYRPLSERAMAVPEGFHVVVVGAGVSGICTAVNLKAAGVPFTVLEKNATVGGVWLENHYPGAGVDTPNHLYSFSFCQYDWPMYFALRNDLHGYLEHVAAQFDLAPNIQLNTQVVSATYEETSQTWQIRIVRPDGTPATLRANVLISAAGIFNPPVRPKIPGLDDFAGPAFHTAQWRDDVDLTGKRVAIIGNGASCMQTGPEIQNQPLFAEWRHLNFATQLNWDKKQCCFTIVIHGQRVAVNSRTAACDAFYCFATN